MGGGGGGGGRREGRHRGGARVGTGGELGFGGRLPDLAPFGFCCGPFALRFSESCDVFLTETENGVPPCRVHVKLQRRTLFCSSSARFIKDILKYIVSLSNSL